MKRSDQARSRREFPAVGDWGLIATSINEDLNAKRLDRYLSLAWNSGASPVIVLTKADLCVNPEAIMLELEQRLPGVPLHAVSAKVTRDGADIMTQLQPYLKPGQKLVRL